MGEILEEIAMGTGKVLSIGAVILTPIIAVAGTVAKSRGYEQAGDILYLSSFVTGNLGALGLTLTRSYRE